MKIIGRILLVLLITAILAAGIYYIVNSLPSSTSTGNFDQGDRPSFQNDGQMTGPGDGSGFQARGGDREGGGASGGWIEILTHAGIFLGAAVVVLGIQKLIQALTKKRSAVQQNA